MLRVIVLLVLLASVAAFQPRLGRNGASVAASKPAYALTPTSLRMGVSIESAYKAVDELKESVPSEDNSRIRLHVKGTSVSGPVFRAEMKKELTFYYRCGAKFTTPYQGKEDEAEIVAEGKTSSLKRFIGNWVKGVCSPMEVRKPSFQGPPLVIEVLEGAWEQTKEEYKSGVFETASEPPTIAGIRADGQREASSMMGSDESV